MQSVRDVIPAGSQEDQRNNSKANPMQKFGSVLINYTVTEAKLFTFILSNFLQKTVS